MEQHLLALYKMVKKLEKVFLKSKMDWAMRDIFLMINFKDQDH